MVTPTPSLASPIKLDLPSRDWDPIVIPQLRAVPVKVMGHSWTVPAGWHKTGNHWSAILPDAGKTGTLTNIGVGGTTMEWWAAVIDANPAGAYAGWVWDRTVTDKRCALMMNVLNSANYLDSDIPTSVDSFEKCARMCAATVLTDRIARSDGGVNIIYSAGWAALGGVRQAYDGYLSVSTTNGSSIIWTPTTDHDYVWALTVAPAPAHSLYTSNLIMRVSVDGETVWEGGPPKVGTLQAGATDTYSKAAIPVGPVAAGVPVVFTRVSGTETGPNSAYFDGFMSLGSKHHIAFTKDPEYINSAAHPGYSVESIRAHNAVLDSIKAEFDAIAPNMVTVVDLEDIATFDATTMLWSGDTLHPNDKGQPWLAAQFAEGLVKNLPYTPRLHTL